MLTDDWTAIRGLVDGIAETARICLACPPIGDNGASLVPIMNAFVSRLKDRLKRFLESYPLELPPAAAAEIRDFLDFQLFGETWPTGQYGYAKIAGMAGDCVKLASEVTFLLADTQQIIRVRSERALEHLQRLIAVSGSARAEWQEAFVRSRGEEACEALGAVHLLWHGIYAFKINSEGARTDLVFPEAPRFDSASRVSDGLVLTEWKVAKDDSEASRKAAEARGQADKYRSSALAGIELRSYRYIVIVSRKELRPIADVAATLAGVLYRHINIAVEPDTPSVRARKATPVAALP